MPTRRKGTVTDIEIDELIEPYATIARIAGIQVALRLAKEYGGEYIFFSTLETVFKNKRNEQIYKDFNGSNYKELSKMYRLTPSSIRKIIEKVKKDRKNKPNEFVKEYENCEQLSAFNWNKKV